MNAADLNPKAQAGVVDLGDLGKVRELVERIHRGTERPQRYVVKTAEGSLIVWATSPEHASELATEQDHEVESVEGPINRRMARQAGVYGPNRRRRRLMVVPRRRA